MCKQAPFFDAEEILHEFEPASAFSQSFFSLVKTQQLTMNFPACFLRLLHFHINCALETHCCWIFCF